MNICRTCRRCYEDTEAVCEVAGHGQLTHAPPGPRLIAEKYRLDHLLGRGGMGAVYSGTHVELERPVAVKLLLPDSVSDPQALERFRREARAAARLNHPNVANTYDYGALPGGEAYIVMELLDGQTLREYLNAEGSLPVKWAVEIARQVGDGIGAAHHSEIVHRDLKPSNIVLTRDHRGELQAKVLDFGIARLLEQTTTSGDPLTATGALIGTPRYMSPEQCAGHDSDARSDVYSLAVILFEMLAGRPPFDAPSATAIALKHVREPPPDLRELRPDAPPALARLVAESLAKEPEARPQTATEFSPRLQDIVRALETDADPPLVLHIPSDETFAATARMSAAAQTSDPPAESYTRPLKNEAPPTEFHPNDVRTDRAGEPTFNDPAPLQDNSAQPSGEIVAPVEPLPQAAAPGASESSEASAAPFRKPWATNAPPEDEAITVVNSSPSGSSRSTGEPRRFPLALVLGSLALVALLGLLFYAWRSPANDDAATADVNATASPLAMPTIQTAATPSQPTVRPGMSPVPPVARPDTITAEKERAALVSTVDSWLGAHNARDLTQVTNFYMPNVSAFYLARNTSRAAVRAEKARLFQETGMSIRRASDPQITFGQDGGTATMIFRKSYVRSAPSQPQSGEVLQEIIWQKTNRGWKIISERDLRVLQ